MDEKKVVIYHHPNPEMKSFLMPREVSAPRVELFRKPLDAPSEAALKHLGVVGAQIVKEIMAIHGVLQVRIKPKEIQVKKEESCSWEDILDRILEILKRAIRRKEMKVV